MKNFNELRNEINEAKKKAKKQKPCTDCDKKAAEKEESDKAAHLADQEKVGPRSGNYRID